LLLISLSYLQLAVGSATSVFTLLPTTYERWIDNCWLVSFWTFLHRLQLDIRIAKHWCPQLTRRDDKVLMDYLIELGYTASTLGALNRCRLYLQIITLSDIVSADGSSIMDEVLHGIPLSDRSSNLTWLCQQRPPTKDWVLWSSALRTLQPRNRLITPLGTWLTCESHQSWFWFKAANSPVVYRRDTNDSWVSFRNLVNSQRFTRSSKLIAICDVEGVPHNGVPINLLPASATFDRYTNTTTITVGPAKPIPPRLPLPKITVSSLLTHDDYFKSFYLSCQFPQENEYEAVAHECQSGISVLYRYDYEPDNQVFGWTFFSTESSEILHTGTAVRSSVTDISTMQRVEVESLLLVLNLLRCILQRFSVQDGKIKVYCLTKKMIKLARGLLYRSASTALVDHGDLLAEMAFVLKRLQHRSAMTYQYLDLAATKGPPIPLQYMAQLGTDISLSKERIVESLPPQDYCSPPNNCVNMTYQGKPLVAKIRSTLYRGMYQDVIQATICQQEAWTASQFHSVDWAAHEQAFLNVWSCKRITLTKLAHKLLNTNVQNKKLYGKSDICPCCRSSPETLTHVFTCPSETMTAFRMTQQEILRKHLDLINTPQNLIQAIQLGIQTLARESPIAPTSPTISIAFHAQTELGWGAFLRGRISSSWRNAFSQDVSAANNKKRLKWAGQLVHHLLHYSQQLWIFRCGVVHGHTKEEHRQCHKEELQHSICTAYEEYEHNPFCVPQDWRRLFSRPVDLLLTSDRDTLMCWLRSYSEACQCQALAISRQSSVAKSFFFPTKQARTSLERRPPVSDNVDLVDRDDTISVSSHITSSDSSDFSDDSSAFSDDSDLGSASSLLHYDPFCGIELPTAACNPDLVEELDTG
jgi:hypothetical protein